MELIKKYRWVIAGGALAVLIVGFLLFRPDKLFVDDTVDESLADAFAPAAEAQATSEDAASEEPMDDATTTTMAAASDESSTDTEDTQDAASEEPAEQAGPVNIAAGEWRGIDHFAEGSVGVYEQDGTYVLRFEDNSNFQNGPDLYVWVLPSEDYEGGTPGEFIDLGKIKGNVGGQNYVLPAEYDPEIHKSVLIWCLRFAVPFAAAPLA